MAVHPGPHTEPSVVPAFCNFANVEPTCVPGQVMTYEGGRVKEIRIYPIDVRRSATAKQSGLPRLAAPELGRRILELVRELSTPFGTDVRIEGNVGIIRPAQ